MKAAMIIPKNTTMNLDDNYYYIETMNKDYFACQKSTFDLDLDSFYM